MLRRSRSSHQLPGLPRSSSRCGATGFLLRCKMLELSCDFNPSGGRLTGCAAFMPGGESELCELPHAEGELARRAHGVYGSSDTGGEGRRTLSELVSSTPPKVAGRIPGAKARSFHSRLDAALKGLPDCTYAGPRADFPHSNANRIRPSSNPGARGIRRLRGSGFPRLVFGPGCGRRRGRGYGSTSPLRGWRSIELGRCGSGV